MARGITENDVWKACDALLLAGERPTIERVRQHIGRGSPNTVSPFLDTWFKGLGSRITDPGAFAAPPKLPDPIHQAAKHFWEVALAQSRLDFDERLKRGLQDAAALVEDAQSSSAAATSQVERLQASVQDLQRGLDARVQECDAERVTHATTKAKLDAETRRTDDLAAKLSGLTAELDAVRRSSADQVRAAQERADGAERRAALEIEAARGERNKAAKRVAQLEARLEEVRAASDQLVAAAAEKAARLEAGLAAAHASVAETERQASEARALAQAMTGRLEDAQSKLAAAEARALMTDELFKRIELLTPAANSTRRTRARAGTASG